MQSSSTMQKHSGPTSKWPEFVWLLPFSTTPLKSANNFWNFVQKCKKNKSLLTLQLPWKTSWLFLRHLQWCKSFWCVSTLWKESQTKSPLASKWIKIAEIFCSFANAWRQSLEKITSKVSSNKNNMNDLFSHLQHLHLWTHTRAISMLVIYINDGLITTQRLLHWTRQSSQVTPRTHLRKNLLNLCLSLSLRRTQGIRQKHRYFRRYWSTGRSQTQSPKYQRSRCPDPFRRSLQSRPKHRGRKGVNRSHWSWKSSIDLLKDLYSGLCFREHWITNLSKGQFRGRGGNLFHAGWWFGNPKKEKNAVRPEIQVYWSGVRPS